MRQDYDALVLGSGIAGLSFALAAARRGARVAIATKMAVPEGSSRYAQGGVASVWSQDDSFDFHAADTTSAGAGLCHREVVYLVVREGPDRIRELIDLGARFTLRDDASDAYDVDLGLEGGHSHRRIIHAVDATGSEMMRTLLEAVAATPGITVFEDAFAIDLLQSAKFGLPGPDRCLGAYVLREGGVEVLSAPATLLATGGAGKVYVYTSNPDVATGDGIAMAYRAGARIGNMEFIQFHPTCLYHPLAKSFLITEALRGEGAVLRRPDGYRFMPDYDERAELAPRDIVARAIDREMKSHGLDHVELDVSAIDKAFLFERFPNIVARCRELGIDPVRTPIPVVPAAHYSCGGVVTDASGRSSLPGLYAAGETAMTGLHGANRLASNSLLEALVFGRRAALAAVEKQQTVIDLLIPEWNSGPACSTEEEILIKHTWDEIRQVMWNYVGIVRSNDRLARARARIELAQEEIGRDYWNFLPTRDLGELRNIATVAGLIVEAAASRLESRGLHFTRDYPATETACQHDTILVRDPLTGRPRLET